MKFRPPVQAEVWGAELADEARAVLAGRAMSIYRAIGLPVPTWAQVNWLAHGRPSEIFERASRDLGFSRPSGTWPWMRSTFAHELLVGSKGDLSIVEHLQRDCLVPVELALMHPDRECVLPDHVVVLGVPHLVSHPSIRTGS